MWLTTPVRTFDELETLWQALPPAPRGSGILRHVVLRKGGGVHEMVESAELDVEQGILSDRWADDPSPKRDCQVTLMRLAVAELVAHDTATIDQPGDNLLVDLDISEDAMPVGTRVHIGSAVLEVTAEPHLGCKNFSARFGPQALKWINWKPHRARRLRGINCRILHSGTLRAGDAIAVQVGTPSSAP